MAIKKIKIGSTEHELQTTIANVTNLQSSLDAKQATVTGAATTITGSNLTASRALISNSSGKVAASDVTSTELGYLDGVTSNVQTQLNGKAASSHTHNYAGSSSAGGAATSANKLNTNAGDSNTPVYFSGGVPVACTSLDLSTTGNAATATKLQNARTIGLTTGATGTATSFNGSANISIPVTDVKEAYLSWGGKNLSGSVTPVGAALSTEHSANRLAYLNPNALAFEYSDNAGSTWTNMSVSDSTKIGFVTTSGSFYVGNASTVTTSHRTRVTLTAQDGTTGYVYTRPRKLLLNVSSAGHGISVTIEVKTGASGASWTSLGTYELLGWSGWNDIPLSIATLGGGTTQTGNYWYMRLTFATTSVGSNTTTKSSIIAMRLFGDTCWTRTSNMGETGHLYSYDTSQNATFPAKVTATSFAGSLTGNATTATKATQDASGNVITSTYATKSHTHTVSHTPAGSVSKPTFTGSAVKSGEPSATATVASSGHTHSVTASGSVSQPTFTGTKATISADYTPAGSVSTPTFTGSAATSGSPSGTTTVASSTHTHKYTPAGTVSAPTFTGSSATSGSPSGTTSVYSITGVGSLPSLSAGVSNKCLYLTFVAGSVPTRSSVTVASSGHTHSVTAKGTVSQPTFTGTEASTTSISGTTSVASSSHTHSVTAKGKVSQPTFTGTEDTISVSYTPTGTVSQPTFTGSAVTSGTPSATATVAGSAHTHSVTASGTVSQPTFTGTAATLTTSTAK